LEDGEGVAVGRPFEPETGALYASIGPLSMEPPAPGSSQLVWGS